MDSEQKSLFDEPLFIPHRQLNAARKAKDEAAEALRIVASARSFLDALPVVYPALKKLHSGSTDPFTYHLFLAILAKENSVKTKAMLKLCGALQHAISCIKPEHDEGWSRPEYKPSVAIPAFLRLLTGNKARKAATVDPAPPPPKAAPGVRQKRPVVKDLSRLRLPRNRPPTPPKHDKYLRGSARPKGLKGKVKWTDEDIAYALFLLNAVDAQGNLYPIAFIAKHTGGMSHTYLGSIEKAGGRPLQHTGGAKKKTKGTTSKGPFADAVKVSEDDSASDDDE